MATDSNTAPSLCSSCALFGLDYSRELDERIRVRGPGEFPKRYSYIPYYRIDTFLDLPSLGLSGAAGCELCIAIRREVQSAYTKYADFKRWSWQRAWGIWDIDSRRHLRNRLVWRWISEKRENKPRDVRLRAGFIMDHHRSESGQNLAFTLSVFVDFVFWGTQESINFEASTTSHGKQ
jgi:hypothetical protein